MDSKVMIIGLDDVKFNKDTVIVALEEALEQIKKELGGHGGSCSSRKPTEPSWQWLIKRKGEDEYTLSDGYYTEREFKEQVLDEDVESYEKIEPSKRMN